MKDYMESSLGIRSPTHSPLSTGKIIKSKKCHEKQMSELRCRDYRLWQLPVSMLGMRNLRRA